MSSWSSIILDDRCFNVSVARKADPRSAFKRWVTTVSHENGLILLVGSNHLMGRGHLSTKEFMWMLGRSLFVFSCSEMGISDTRRELHCLINHSSDGTVQTTTSILLLTWLHKWVFLLPPSMPKLFFFIPSPYTWKKKRGTSKKKLSSKSSVPLLI